MANVRTSENLIKMWYACQVLLHEECYPDHTIYSGSVSILNFNTWQQTSGS